MLRDVVVPEFLDLFRAVALGQPLFRHGLMNDTYYLDQKGAGAGSGVEDLHEGLKVVALSGGYTRQEANARLSRNNGAVASFSRALSEGLTAQQSDAEFGAMLDSSIESIYQASKT